LVMIVSKGCDRQYGADRLDAILPTMIFDKQRSSL
jgi:hypothetical protein